jgi:hypothetical protein
MFVPLEATIIELAIKLKMRATWIHTGSLDSTDGKVSDWDTSGWGSSWGTVLVILLDDNTIFGDVLEGDVLVCYAGDGTSCARDSFDADTVVRVGDGGRRDGDVLDDVIGATTDTADGEAVTAGAGSTGEGDVLT